MMIPMVTEAPQGRIPLTVFQRSSWDSEYILARITSMNIIKNTDSMLFKDIRLNWMCRWETAISQAAMKAATLPDNRLASQ